jgi:hypothetical protein
MVKPNSMKYIKTVVLTLFLGGLTVNQTVASETIVLESVYLNYPAKTVVIKNMAADDTKTFFSSAQVYNFEVYQAGKDMPTIIASFLSDKSVASCVAGSVVGDFTSVTLVLKTNKDKAWFISEFKKAGLNTIKINQKEVQNVDKM